MDVASLTLATVLGGVLAILGGSGGSILLARMERKRETQRQQQRHRTAVRIVVLELTSNGNAIARRARTDLSTAGHQAVAIDLYGSSHPISRLMSPTPTRYLDLRLTWRMLLR